MNLQSVRSSKSILFYARCSLFLQSQFIFYRDSRLDYKFVSSDSLHTSQRTSSQLQRTVTARDKTPT